jgi:hypothetical protein
MRLGERFDVQHDGPIMPVAAWSCPGRGLLRLKVSGCIGRRRSDAWHGKTLSRTTRTLG